MAHGPIDSTEQEPLKRVCAYVEAAGAFALVTLVALGVFGWGKSRVTGLDPLRGALQTMLVGGLAAGVAYGIARVISGLGPTA